MDNKLMAGDAAAFHLIAPTKFKMSIFRVNELMVSSGGTFLSNKKTAETSI